jgi:PilZ domain-containing protein
MSSENRRKPPSAAGTPAPASSSQPQKQAAPKAAGAAKPAKSSGGGSERRQHPRVEAKLPLKIVNEAGKEEAFTLVDLSEAGARIQCSHAVAPMTRIQVALFLPGKGVGLEKQIRVDTAGVIVWCHRVGDGRFDTGVFFADLEEEQRGLLRALVQATK